MIDMYLMQWKNKLNLNSQENGWILFLFHQGMDLKYFFQLLFSNQFYSKYNSNKYLFISVLLFKY
jgi:hypothetical protein